jgi:hypothetical protein
MNMTTVIVHSGACGFSVTIHTKRKKDGTIAVSLDSECEMVMRMLEDIAVVDRLAPLAGFQNNPVLRSAGKRLKHAACPVPSAIIKALEVEAGFNVARDAKISFVTEQEAGKAIIDKK